MMDRFKEPTRAEERMIDAFADFAESNWDLAFRKASERLKRDPTEEEVEEELSALYRAAGESAEAFYESLGDPDE